MANKPQHIPNPWELEPTLRSFALHQYEIPQFLLSQSDRQASAALRRPQGQHRSYSKVETLLLCGSWSLPPEMQAVVESHYPLFLLDDAQAVQHTRRLISWLWCARPLATWTGQHPEAWHEEHYNALKRYLDHVVRSLRIAVMECGDGRIQDMGNTEEREEAVRLRTEIAELVAAWAKVPPMPTDISRRHSLRVDSVQADGLGSPKWLVSIKGMSASKRVKYGLAGSTTDADCSKTCTCEIN